MVGAAKEKSTQNKNALGEAWEKLQLLFDVSQSWIKGEYKEIPVGSIVMIIATVIYFVSPVDLIPDFIAGFGLFDDAAVIAYTVKQISSDLDNYKLWKEQKGLDAHQS
ncbi:YkvA family protein [Virgibacillus siamensis]|uniref:YkvA family protein n=1 Tax=Virgibacillus siamensis TaxID=480071 RepID=UPI001FE5F29B|nr:YkvA family protein [Virgibacillus siamensis]